MSTTEDLKKRLAALGLDRKWLAEKTGYKPNTIMHALAPNSPNKTDKTLRRIRQAIEAEESSRLESEEEKTRIYHLDFSPRQFEEIYQAASKIKAPSIHDYCVDCVIVRTREILRSDRLPLLADVSPPVCLKVADDPMSLGNVRLR